MSGAILGYTPTCVLRKIDPNTVCKQYFNGSYQGVTLAMLQQQAASVNLSSKLTTMTTINSQTTTSTDANSDLFMYRDSYNKSHVIATTNTAQYNIYLETGHLPKPNPEGAKCAQCRGLYTTYSVGIPIRLVVIDYPGEIKPVQVRIYFMTNMDYCSFECVLRVIRRHFNQPFSYRNPHLMDSEQQLKDLFHLMYPNEGPLKEAADTDLLKINGGPLTHNDYHRHVYVPTYNIVTPPVKMLHFRND